MNSILLLHGALGSRSQMEPLQQRLGQAGKNVYSINFSGHGGKPFSKNGFGIETFTKEVINFLDDKKIESIDIFGYSMGGYVGMWTAWTDPSRINRICTLGTKLNWSVDEAEKAALKLNLEEIQRKVPVYAQALERVHGTDNVKLLLQQTADMMKGLGQSPLLTESILHTFKNPLTIGLGDRDDPGDLVYSKQVSQSIPDCTFVLLKDTPHPFEKVNIELLMPYILM